MVIEAYYIYFVNLQWLLILLIIIAWNIRYIVIIFADFMGVSASNRTYGYISNISAIGSKQMNTRN